jgi:two-component system, chemotaxis family, chemotaxis protein CheY
MTGKVLIVDDAAFMRAVLKGILVQHGLEVIGEAENGKVAIEKYRALKPDLVTMDITMPVMEGVEAVRRIVELDPSAKVVMCSAMGQQAIVVDAIRAGAKDFVVKPFHPERVVQAVSSVLGSV